MVGYLGAILFRGEQTPFLDQEGQPLLESMLTSLRRCRDIREVVIVSPPDCPAAECLVHLARKLRVRYLPLQNGHALAVVRLALSLLSSRGIVLIPASHPFVHGGAIRSGIARLERTKADIVTFEGFPEGSVPLMLMSRGHLVKGGMGIVLHFLTGGRWGRSLGRFVRGGGRAEISRWDDTYGRRLSISLTVQENSDLDRLSRIWPKGLAGSDPLGILLAHPEWKEDETCYELLVREAKDHPNPHLLNERINAIEMNMGKAVLTSYPVEVGLNLTPLCNARCTFCTYDPKQLVRRDFVSMEAIHQMTWLRHVSHFSVWAGIGDSLIHPLFPEIFEYFRESYGHLRIHLSTNGIALSPRVSDTLVGRLDSFNCSYDAAHPKTYQRMMGVDRWQTIYDNLKYLSRKRKDLGTAKPEMFASIVMTRENLEELGNFVEVASELGLDGVTFAHFVTTTTIGRRPLHASSSLYYYKDLADRHLAAAIRKAERHGLRVNAPPLFSDREVSIAYGARIRGPLRYTCQAPWRSCFLTVNELGVPEMVFCCSGLYYHLEYDKNDLSEAALWKLWNHPTAQYFRSTANRPGKNPLCVFCRSEDRFDPAVPKIYEIYRHMDPLFQEWAGKASGQVPRPGNDTPGR